MKYTKKLSSDFVAKYVDKTPPWGPLGYIVYKRTYSRMTPEGTTEEWYQTIERCINGLLSVGGIFTNDDVEMLFHYMFNLKCSMSGRSLWQLGTGNVERIGADSLQNCWQVGVNHPVDPFCFTFNELMLGGGVGFNITPEQVYEMPPVKYGVTITRVDDNDVDFIVPDNREGWVELLRRVLECFFFTGKNLRYSTNCIRARGKIIKTFGGTASGSENLVTGISNMVNILNARVNHKLRPIDALDIMNIIGDIVVAGNVRRSAEIAIGSHDDIAFLNAKNWNQFTIPNWRGMSNNTVQCSEIAALPDEFWRGYEGEGEPYGLFNLDLCRSTGRLADGDNYRLDPRVIGLNPCGEIPLESYEACNLGEIFLPNIHSMEEFLDAAKLMYMVCKSVSALPFSYPVVNEVVSRNHRLGVSVTGFLQSSWISKLDSFTQVYRSLEELDIMYSRELGIGESNKLTTVKPSGTLSLLPGVTPGVHPAFARYYIRRVRFSATDPLVDVCRKKGYPVEPKQNIDKTRDLNTMVVSFPVETPNGAVLAKDIGVIDQMKLQQALQTYWSDNSVSVSCYYSTSELPEIHQYLRETYDESIKSVSFFPHAEHGFIQAPMEEIDEKKYRLIADHVQPITSATDKAELGLIDNLECASGGCPVR